MRLIEFQTMNLLVTNTRNAQAYGVIRSLRPYANKIVATRYGPNRFVARLSHAANSRYVDKRYFVPSPVEDWRNGRIQRENTEREEEYIQAILRICEQEAIDVIFPSWEPKVYIFSKNKERFKERKIVLPIPDYEALVCAMDKYRVIKIAEKVGFPCPRTLAVDEEDQLEAVERQLQYPVVVKPRFSSGGGGLFLCRNRAELLERFRSAQKSRGLPLVQEYIPGSIVKRFANVWIVLDQDYKLKAATLSRKIRTIFRDSVSQGTAWESFEDDGLIDAATELCRALRLNGFVNFQTKQDPRDGLHKLVEVNPRIGYAFWIPLAQGIDTPLLALNVAKGEEFGAIEPVKGRTVFITPVQDTWAFMVYMVELFAAKILGYHPIDAENSPPPLMEMLNSYRESYTASRKVFDPYLVDFFRDPLVSITWWAAFGVFNLQQKLHGIRPFRQVSPSQARAAP
jgi:predicted ATP-grasp superfamily ATP-dependent carboligase